MHKRTNQTRQIHLVRRPVGMPVAEDFAMVDVDLPELGMGEIQVKNLYMSVDPYMRPRMIARDSYIEPFELDSVLEGEAVGVVTHSKHSDWAVGDLVLSFKGWREAFNASGDPVTPRGDALSEKRKGVTKLPSLPVPPSYYLGVLGTTGLTAYIGLKVIGEMKGGETVLISGAAGGVGHLAGQIAKQAGCFVIGSAGSSEKCDFLTQKCGFDAAFNYKTNDLEAAIANHAPDGLDIYFDNVGGDMVDAALNNMRRFGRVATSGMISDYNSLDSQPQGIRNYFQVIARELKIRGFVVMSHLDAYEQFINDMLPLIQSGNIHFEQTLYNGLDQAAEGFMGLFNGANTGKTFIKLADL
jgi:NADPH-dependent curcumin reductase CurA